VLASIGAGALPWPLAEELDALRTEFDQPAHPAFDTWHESHHGPTASRSAGELLTLPDDALLTHLRRWRPDPTSVFGPSIRGQAQALMTATSTAPQRFAQLLAHFPDAPISYIGAVLHGLREAPGSTRAAMWPPVLEVIHRIVGLPAGDPTPSSATTRPDPAAAAHSVAPDGDDGGWTDTKLAAAILLANRTADHAWVHEHATAAVAALELLVDDLNPTSEDEQRFAPPASDSLTAALNSVRPTALRALANLVSHDLPADIEARALAALDQHWGPIADLSLAVAATTGEALRSLLDTHPDWTLARAERVLGPPALPPAPEQADPIDTTWSMILAGPPHPRLLEALRPWFARAVSELANPRVLTEGWRQQRNQRLRLGDHLLDLVISGDLAPDDALVADYFNRALPTERAQVLERVGNVVRSRIFGLVRVRAVGP